MRQDILADAFAAIDNAREVGKKEVTIKPASELIKNVLIVLQKNGYIGLFEHVENNQGGKFKVEIGRSINKASVVKPRFSVSKDGYQKYEKRFLPARGFGDLIVTTPEGVMSHQEAREKGIGGKLLGYVY